MNKQTFTSILLVMLIGIFGISCSKEDTENEINLATKVSGTYHGTISFSENPTEKTNATINFSRLDGTTIHLKLRSGILDTAFMLNLYENGDSIMVCLNGEDFNEMYGHQLDEDHHMMDEDGHMSWDHHMNEQHEPADEHFGGFDQKQHAFHYKFLGESESDSYYYFEGKKE